MSGRLGLVAGVLVMVEGAYFGLSLRGIGFPDGHRTELDRWREVTYPVFVGLLLVGAMMAFYAAVRRRESRVVPVVVLALGVVCLVVDVVSAGFVDHGGGG